MRWKSNGPSVPRKRKGFLMTDLTKGSALKQIFRFAIPYLIGNLFQQFYNIADMVIVGRTLDPLAYTAVASTGSLVWFSSGAIQSLTMGFSVVVAQYFGSGDKRMVKKAFGASIWLSSIISVLVSVFCVCFSRPMLSLLQTPQDIFDRSHAYLVWVFGGLIATALYNLLSNVIRALGDSKTPLYFLIIACVLNIILDFVFIEFCGMDTDGAGLATVLAQLISALCCIVYICKKQPLLHVSRDDLAWNRPLNRQLLRIGIPMAFLNMVLSIGSIVMQFVTNGMGTAFVAAQSTGAKIEQFVTMPILSFGSAVAVFSAQNYGARKYSRVLEGGRKGLFLCYVWSVIAALILLPFGHFIIRLLAGDVSQSVVDNAYLYIMVNTLLCFILSPLVIYKNVLQSVNRTFWTMISGFTEIAGRAGVAILVLWLLSRGLADQTGFFMMCFANPAAWLMGLLTVLLDYIPMTRGFRRRIREESQELLNSKE